MAMTTATAPARTVIQHGPHSGHVLTGNYKLSTDKAGRMVAHVWLRLASRWVRCDLATALAGGGA